MGSYEKHGALYDYSGVWQRKGGVVDWKAIVRSADVLCRPRGTIDHEPEGRDLVVVLQGLVEAHIEDALAKR